MDKKKLKVVEKKAESPYQIAVQICKEKGLDPSDLLGDEELVNNVPNLMQCFVDEILIKLSLVTAVIHLADNEDENISSYELRGIKAAIHDTTKLAMAAVSLYARTT